MNESLGLIILWKMLPGHFRAITFWEIVGLSILFFVVTESIVPGIAITVYEVGGFFTNQATHLSQPNHRFDVTTAFEQWLQSNRWLATGLGILMKVSAVAFIVVMFS